MYKLDKNNIVELFEFLELILNENPIEYQSVRDFGINEMIVIKFLKNTNQYDDTKYLNTQHYLTNYLFTDKEIIEKIEEEMLCYSFTDLEFYFKSKNSSGYEIASEFLSSNFCSEKQYKSFLNTILAYSKEVELTKEQEKQYQKYFEKINGDF